MQLQISAGQPVVVSIYDCQHIARESSGFNPSITRIWGIIDEAVWKKVHENRKKLLLILKKEKNQKERVKGGMEEVGEGEMGWKNKTIRLKK